MSTTSIVRYSTSTESHRAMLAERERRTVHAERTRRMIDAADTARDLAQFRTEAGYCTACGSVEVLLDRVPYRTPDGTPCGWGCEVCS